MRKFFTILISALLAISVFAQTPQKMSYQAVIRNSSDILQTNTQIGMEINILQGSVSGSVVYTETQTPTTNANGLISIEIGGEDGFATIDWSNGPYFIETKTDPTGGTNYTITGTSQLLYVPYALHAKTAETVTGVVTETDPVYTAWDKSAGISITESQISDFGSYIETESDPAIEANFDFAGAEAGDLLQFDGTRWVKQTPEYLTNYTETDPEYVAWDKSTGIFITESQISDLGNYIVTESDPAVAANFDFTGADAGDLLQFDGTKWVKVTPGYLTSYTESQNLNDVLSQNNSAGSQNITNLADPQNSQDAATKAYIDGLLAGIEALEETVLLNIGYTDSRDGNHYNAVKIGTQIWMAENLKYLPSVVGPVTGSNSDPYYYVYGYDGTDVSAAKATGNYSTYGVLYNWTAAMNSSASSSANPSGVQGVCPAGWHLPGDAEWTQLVDYLGGLEVTGGKLKETGTTHWVSPNTGATNETGFTALPGGSRNYGTFDTLGSFCRFWCATQGGTTYSWHRGLSNGSSAVNYYYTEKELGMSVRCVWD